MMDAVGHYARPDLFTLTLDAEARVALQAPAAHSEVAAPVGAFIETTSRDEEVQHA